MSDFIEKISSIWWWLELVPPALVALAIAWLFKRTPSYLGRLFRFVKIRDLRKIRSKRFNYAAVTYDIVKTHSLMVLFIALCIFYTFYYAGSEYEGMILFVKTLPLYVVQILYMNQHSFTKELILRVGAVKRQRIS